MLISEFRFEFSYIQFAVYDSGSLPAVDEWSDDRFARGFVGSDSFVNFVTLLEFGYAQVQVFEGDYVHDNADERVIKVPFYCPTGKVLVDGPEETEPHSFGVDPGHYLLTAAQRADDDEETLYVKLYFQKVETPATRSEIVVKDDQLDPHAAPLETAEY